MFTVHPDATGPAVEEWLFDALKPGTGDEGGALEKPAVERPHESRRAIALLRRWESESGDYDEKVLPELRRNLDAARSGYRQLFPGE